jgi:hypothetical protein
MSQNGKTNWQVYFNYGCLSGEQSSHRIARAMSVFAETVAVEVTTVVY